MKTFLKILAAVALVAVIWHFAPVLLVPVIILAFVSLAVGVVLGVLGLILLAGLIALALALIGALSPIWIPVLCICGLIWMIKKLTAKPANPPVVTV